VKSQGYPKLLDFEIFSWWIYPPPYALSVNQILSKAQILAKFWLKLFDTFRQNSRNISFPTQTKKMKKSFSRNFFFSKEKFFVIKSVSIHFILSKLETNINTLKINFYSSYVNHELSSKGDTAHLASTIWYLPPLRDMIRRSWGLLTLNFCIHCG